MCLLSKRFSADLTLERFFSRMRSQMNFDIRLVEESAIADSAPMDRLLLAERVELDAAGSRARRAPGRS